eukprot:gene10912-10994_t
MSMTNGSDPEDIAAGMARLEAALDRIGILASQVQPGAVATLVAAAQEPAAAAPRDPASPEVLDRKQGLAQVTVKINGYSYTVGCEDGQEAHLIAMAAQVESRIDSIKALGSSSGEQRLLVLAALLMADELHDTRVETDTLRGLLAEKTRTKPEVETAKKVSKLAAPTSRGLALQGSWSLHLVPTCSRRPWEDDITNGFGGSAPFLTDSDAPLARAKAEARSKALAARQGCDPLLGQRLGQHLVADFPPPEAAVVSGFWPIGDEIDIRPLLEALHARGHPIALPETPKRGNPLIFRQWWPGIAMQRERFGTFRPEGPQIEPGFLLVPLLAFDSAGRRLGYGGGYYDRTLAQLPGAIAVGCGYAAQQLDEVPAGEPA